MNRVLLCLIILGGAVVNRSFAGQPGDTSGDEVAIRKADEAYVNAFNKHDAKALADAWSPEAVYLNRVTGAEVVGRAAIAEQFTAVFKDQPEVKLELSAQSIQFVSPNVAVEQGIAKTLVPKADPEEEEYSAVYVRREGQWLLDRVTEKTKEVTPSRYEQLKPLEWMIGRWVDKDDDDNVDIETECKWTKNQSFITRSFTVSAEGKINMSGMQIIGWDPVAKAIRSWTFDSDNGFSEANWTLKKDRWFIQNKGYLADGRKASMTNVIKQVDQNSFTWQTIERSVGGELLPNINEVVIVRE
ncbi:MAG: SgcJ/EcaC family oxidoreductase [Planctomycetota bacterium]